MLRYLKNKKGSALITCYLVITALLMFGGAVLGRALSQIRACNTFIYNAKAFYAAELALADAFWRYDNDLVLPIGITQIESTTFAYVENLDPAFATFKVQAFGFVSESNINPKASRANALAQSIVSKRIQNTGVLNTFLNTISGGVGDKGIYGRFIVTSYLSNLDPMARIGLQPSSGEINIDGRIMLKEDVALQDNGVRVNFSEDPIKKASDELGQPMLDVNGDGKTTPIDFRAFIDLAKDQLSARHPGTVVLIPIPASYFVMSRARTVAPVKYILELQKFDPKVKTVLIYPEGDLALFNRNVQYLTVAIAGTLEPDLDRTFVVAGKTEANFEATDVDLKKQERSAFTLMSLGEVSLGSKNRPGTPSTAIAAVAPTAMSTDADKENVGVTVMTPENVKMVASTDSDWNATLLAGKDIEITTLPDTHFTMKNNEDLFHKEEPDVFKVKIPAQKNKSKWKL